MLAKWAKTWYTFGKKTGESMNFLFDLYGTLLDIHTEEDGRDVWERIATILGEPLASHTAIEQEYHALCAAHCTDAGKEFDLLAVFAQMVKTHAAPMDAGALAHAFRMASMKKLCLFPHVKEMLADLRAVGAGVYLVSNAQACFTHRELSDSGLTPYFDGILLSSEAGWKKPAPQIFEVASGRFGIDLSDAIYVGNDLRDDVLGATRVGMPSVYIHTPQSGCYEGMPQPTYVAEDHAELRTLLHSLAKGKK